MTGIYRRYIELPKKDDRDVCQPKIGHNKNQFVSLCTSKDCREFIYMGEEIARTKGLCLKHYNQFIEIRFKSITTIKRRKICKLCGQAIKNKRNKLYCSVTCRQKASRKIPSLSIEKLVQSPEWRKVDRLIKSSPFGLNSINYESTFYELLTLVSLCHFERLQGNKFFKYHHIIPLRFNGMNTLSNIIIAPSFIKHSDNLALANSAKANKRKPYYINNSVIDTCLKDKNLAHHLHTLIEIIESIVAQKTLTPQEKNIFVEKHINSIKAVFLFYLYKSKKYSPLFLLNHIAVQSYVISEYQQFKPINDLIKTCEKLKEHENLTEEIKFDLFNLIALTCYVAILNFSHQQYDFLVKINQQLTFLDKKNLLNIPSFYKINSILMVHIVCYIKYDLKKDNLTNNSLSYGFIKRFYDKYYPKKK